MKGCWVGYYLHFDVFEESCSNCRNLRLGVEVVLNITQVLGRVSRFYPIMGQVWRSYHRNTRLWRVSTRVFTLSNHTLELECSREGYPVLIGYVVVLSDDAFRNTILPLIFGMNFGRAVPPGHIHFVYPSPCILASAWNKVIKRP